MDSLTDSIVKHCVSCQIATPKTSREPLKMTPLRDGPWEQVSINFCEVSGRYVLVVVDDYSRFPEAEIVHTTSAKVVTPKLDCIFAAYGVPKVVKSDNGPHSIGMSLHSLQIAWVSSIARLPPCGLKRMTKLNAL